MLNEKKISGEAVKLKSVLIDEAAQKNYAEIIINTESIIDDIDQVNVKFERAETVCHYSDLNSAIEVGSLVSVKAKLHLQNSVKKNCPI